MIIIDKNKNIYDTNLYGLETIAYPSHHQRSIIRKKKNWYFQDWYDDFDGETTTETKINVILEFKTYQEAIDFFNVGKEQVEEFKQGMISLCGNDNSDNHIV